MTTTVSRRAFLRRAGTSAAVFAAPAIVPASALAQPAPSDRVHTGHIGVGGQGSGLLRGFMGLPMVTSVATADPVKSRREAAAHRVEKFYAGRAGRGSFKRPTGSRSSTQGAPAAALSRAARHTTTSANSWLART